MRLFSRSIYPAILQPFPSAASPSDQSSFVSCLSRVSFDLPEIGVYGAVAFSGIPLKQLTTTCRHCTTAIGHRQKTKQRFDDEYNQFRHSVQRYVEALLEVLRRC
jgi:hypothetical protein